MTLTLILNIVFAVAVVGGIVALLGGAILTDRPRARARVIGLTSSRTADDRRLGRTA